MKLVNRDVRATARKRMSRLSTAEILDWADQAGNGLAKGLDDYRRLGESESLEEARIGLEALQGALDVLLERD